MRQPVLLLLSLIIISAIIAGCAQQQNVVGQATVNGVSQQLQAFSPASSKLETVPLQQRFDASAEAPLAIDRPIYGLALSAKIDLPETDSLVRVILVDRQGAEHLVLESFPLLGTKGRATVEHFCEETCVLEGVTPDRLKVQAEGGVVEVQNIKIITDKAQLHERAKKEGIAATRQELKRMQDAQKIDRINSEISATGKQWVAGETSVSKMMYAEKRALFKSPEGEPIEYVPNLQGFEYYTSGVFDIGGGKGTGGKPVKILPPPPVPGIIAYPTSAGAAAPAAMDYRSLHGENWMTPVRSQGSCGSCWAFATMGETEANINLHYNQHLDIDLSEQDSVCRHPGSCANGGSLSYTASELQGTGLVDEACQPYTATDTVCTKCADASSRQWRITSYGSFGTDDETIKQNLVSRGPTSFGIRSWWHFMTLAGYYPSSTPGETVWILKNSWGSGWGEAGYTRITVPTTDRYGMQYVTKPYVANDANRYQISCVDKDADGFCNWGISASKPSTCPSTCAAQKDCDDANSQTGACQQVKQQLSVTCRENVAAQCVASTEVCPAGYTRIMTGTACSTVYKWSYCIRDAKACDACPAGTGLVAYTWCGATQACTTNGCA